MKAKITDTNQTGVVIIEGSTGEYTTYPLFTRNYIEESSYLLKELKVDREAHKVYVFSESTSESLNRINEIQSKYGFLPENYTAELRTGFSSNRQLTQCSLKFCYA